ncbi:hypothetical protein BMETH_8841832367, partial [methanotrophic bacterial endosymbiont of Bathymodiolus sp.]
VIDQPNGFNHIWLSIDDVAAINDYGRE